MPDLFVPISIREELEAQAMAKAEAALRAKAKAEAEAGLSIDDETLRWALQPGRPAPMSSNWAQHRREVEHFTGWDYIAIDALAAQVAQATVEVYRDESRIEERDKARWATRHRGARMRIPGRRINKGYGNEDMEAELVGEGHPLVELLMRPNPWQTGGLLRYEQAMQLRLTGVALTWNVPNQAGLTVERYVLPTAVVDPVAPRREKGLEDGGWRVNPAYMPRLVDRQGFFQAGSLGFFLSAGLVLPASQVQVLAMPHPISKQDGQSPISASALWNDTARAIDAARKSQLDNGANPSLGISFDAKDGSRMPYEVFRQERQRFVNEYAGAKQHRGVMMLQGATFTPLGHTAVDMDYAAGFRDMRDAQLATHRTHAMVIGAEVPGTYGALAAAIQQYDWGTVKPLLCMLSDHDTLWLADQFGPGLTIWYESQNYANPDLRAKALRLAVAAKNVIRVNEYRAALSGLGVKLNPLEGEEGDEFVGAAPTKLGFAALGDEDEDMAPAGQQRLLGGWDDLSKAAPGCGANATGGGGFQPGNNCAAGDQKWRVGDLVPAGYKLAKEHVFDEPIQPPRRVRRDDIDTLIRNARAYSARDGKIYYIFPTNAGFTVTAQKPPSFTEAYVAVTEKGFAKLEKERYRLSPEEEERYANRFRKTAATGVESAFDWEPVETPWPLNGRLKR